MPTLERRVEDGVYYIRHFFHEHSTWQVLGEGVRILGNRGVVEGGRFSTDLFMYLWARRLIYHGDTIPEGSLHFCPDSGVTVALQKRVAEFYRLVYAGAGAAAWKLVTTSMVVQEPEEEEEARNRFTNQIQRVRLASWKVTDCQAYDICPVAEKDGHPSFRVTKLGVAQVRLSLRNNVDPIAQRDFKHYWVYSEGNWWTCGWCMEPYAIEGLASGGSAPTEGRSDGVFRL